MYLVDLLAYLAHSVGFVNLETLYADEQRYGSQYRWCTRSRQQQNGDAYFAQWPYWHSLQLCALHELLPIGQDMLYLHQHTLVDGLELLVHRQATRRQSRLVVPLGQHRVPIWHIAAKKQGGG